MCLIEGEFQKLVLSGRGHRAYNLPGESLFTGLDSRGKLYILTLYIYRDLYIA